ncbi:response regulator [Mesorhizobium sp. B3-2-1]|uniref:response regulator n=1 Tax=Mesorhizobium sp. B3-2-1 TaxID=2589891 RepID=UPI00112DC3DF|nr:response regulator [Mesorhizobium sp. B3-2-1]TPI24058.1 response regulator [Mesorhizobium sp. B3-2-1]
MTLVSPDLAERAIPKELGLGDGAILIVEDHVLVRMDIVSGLEDAGFVIVSAKNAELAIEMFDADPPRICALVTDVRLGSGKLGWEIARHLRHAVPAMPVIYVSGESARNWGKHGVPNSIMISKPFEMARLVTELSNLLDQQSLGEHTAPADA